MCRCGAPAGPRDESPDSGRHSRTIRLLAEAGHVDELELVGNAGVRAEPGHYGLAGVIGAVRDGITGVGHDQVHLEVDVDAAVPLDQLREREPIVDRLAHAADGDHLPLGPALLRAESRNDQAVLHTNPVHEVHHRPARTAVVADLAADGVIRNGRLVVAEKADGAAEVEAEVGAVAALAQAAVNLVVRPRGEIHEPERRAAVDEVERRARRHVGVAARRIMALHDGGEAAGARDVGAGREARGQHGNQREHRTDDMDRAHQSPPRTLKGEIRR